MQRNSIAEIGAGKIITGSVIAALVIGAAVFSAVKGRKAA